MDVVQKVRYRWHLGLCDGGVANVVCNFGKRWNGIGYK